MAAADKHASVLKQVSSMKKAEQDWPALPLGEWESTYRTLHRWTQIVGKIRLGFTPLLNHWWNVALYVNPRGLTTSTIPYQGGAFEIQFDFVHHRLEIRTSDGVERVLALSPKSVAAFYRELLSALHEVGIDVQINTKPQEIPDPIALDRDETHASYDPEYANRFWRILQSTEAVFQEFRARFLGKQSPVHFFWGAFDLACTRFSGRPAPLHPGGVPNCPDYVQHEAYSHECISAGWWPGGGPVREAAFYAYAYPEPAGLAQASIRPAAAYYHGQMREFILPYEALRAAP